MSRTEWPDCRPTHKPRRDTRHIGLARSLHARLYVTVEGRIFVVRGDAAHSRLATALARYDRPPTAAESPTPVDFGIDACDGELTADVLERIRLALYRWENDLHLEAQRKPARRRNASRLRDERLEVERLGARCTLLRQWQAEFAAGREPAGAPLFLDPVAECGLRKALDEAEQEQPLGSFVAWHARVVAWLAGDCAVRRYLAAVTGLMRACPEISRYEQIRGLQNAAMSWKRRSAGERPADLRREIAAHFERISGDLLSEGAFPTRLDGRKLTEICDRIVAAGRELLAKNEGMRQELLSKLAALAAVDGSAVPFPRRTFETDGAEEDVERLKATIVALSREIGLPGYDTLLKVLDDFPASLPHVHYDELRALLAKGNSPADVIWAFEFGLHYCLSNSCLSVREARRLGERFTHCGAPLAESELSSLIYWVEDRKDLSIHV